MRDLNIQFLASKVKLVVLDVDGVLTDGSITYDDNGVEYKTFNVKDGQGIALLEKNGIKTAIITARQSATVKYRADNLGMFKLYQGQKNKETALDELIDELNISYSEVAYMGDDIPDICALKKVGLPACPADAVDIVKDYSKYISSKNGGRGAVRELSDLILKSQNFYPSFK